jgi:membrane fusion protein (multidrug efflux system)
MSNESPAKGPQGELQRATGPEFAKSEQEGSKGPIPAPLVADAAPRRLSVADEREAADQTARAGTAAQPAQGLAQSLEEAARAGKGIAIPAGRSPAAQGERQLSKSRVITGEVMPPRRSRRRFVLAALLIAVLSVGGYYGFGWWTTGRFIVSTDDAYIAADMSVLAAKVSGLITEVGVTDNQFVRAGTVLVSIDDGDYKLAVDAAANRLATQDATIARIGKQIEAQLAAIAQAKAQLASAEAERVRAEAAFERASKLAAADFGSRATLDQARADRDKALAAITAARSGLDQANAQIDVLKAQQAEAVRSRAELVTALDRAKRDLEFTRIRAPFDGVVGNRAVQPGQYVQAGSRVMALVPLDSVRVEANLKETQLAGVKVGQLVDLSIDAFGGRVITGRVESIAPASGSLFSLLPPENATGNFTKIVQRLTVRIALPADVIAERILRPGMSVIVGINTREPGSHVVGEDLPERVALLLGDARDAALRLIETVAAKASGSPAGAPAPEAPRETARLVDLPLH